MKRGLFLFVLSLIAAGSLLYLNRPIVTAQMPQGGEPFHCVQTVSTATAITAFGGVCAAIEADRSFYISSVYFSANSAGIAADSFPTLKYGVTTATVTVFWGAFVNSANVTPVWETIVPPVKLPPGNIPYWINSTAGSKFITIDGVKGPQ